MKYGQYYIDSMLVGDETGDHYNAVYLGDPKERLQAPEVDNFTVTESESKAAGGMDRAIENYMQKYHPETQSLIEGCTAVFNKRSKRLSISVFGKVIISVNVGDDQDYWIGHIHKDQDFDFNFYQAEDKDCEQEFGLVVYPVLAGKTDTSRYQSIPLAHDVAGEIKNLLSVLGLNKLRIDEPPPPGLCWGIKAPAAKTRVSEVGIEGDGSLYIILEDKRGRPLTRGCEFGDISKNELKMALIAILSLLETRMCVECGRLVYEGFAAHGGLEYYCCEDCLHKHYSAEIWEKMCEGAKGREYVGNDRNFRTSLYDA